MNWNHNWVWLCIVILCMPMLQHCGIYSLSGVNIPDDVKSISIEYFPNQAPQIAPTLSQEFTEKLRDKFQNETRLYLRDEEGDYQISGVITDYRIEPVGVTGNTEAAENRITMSAKLSFKCPKHPDFDFEKTYSNFRNFEASINIDAIESELIRDLTDMMVQDIFNDIALKW